jgi:hypothetical protein
MEVLGSAMEFFGPREAQSRSWVLDGGHWGPTSLEAQITPGCPGEAPRLEGPPGGSGEPQGSSVRLSRGHWVLDGGFGVLDGGFGELDGVF